MGATNHMARMACTTDLLPFNDYGIFSLFKFTIPGSFIFRLFCSLNIGFHCHCLEKRGKDRRMIENQSLECDRAYCALFSEVCGLLDIS